MFNKSSNSNLNLDNQITSSEFFSAIKSQNTSLIQQYFSDTSNKVWLLKEADGYTCLHRAVFMNSLPLTNLIISELKKRFGLGSSSQLLKFLNEKTSEGFTALHYAACKGNIPITKFLIENGAEVESVTNRGKNVMHLAAESNQPSIMVYFIHYQSQDIFSIDEYGSTPLHWACYSGAEETVSLLLSLNASINAKDKEGFTPLHLAVQSNKEKIVLKLLQSGADKNIKNLKGEFPIDIANKNKYYKIYNMLENNDFNPLCSLDMPINYIRPENIYKKFIWVIICLPEIIVVTLILPFLNNDNYEKYLIYGNLGLFILCLLNYFLLLSFESGYVKNDELIRDANGENPLKYLIDQNKDIKNYCPKCFVLKNKNIKHCFICDKCIEGLEHHCFWLNKCIGKGNKISYVFFIIISLFYSLLNIFISTLCIYSDYNIIETSLFFFWISNDRDYTGLRILGCAFVLCYSVIFSFPLIFLFLMKIFKTFGLFNLTKSEENLLKNNENEIKNEILIDDNNNNEKLIDKEVGMIEINNEDEDTAFVRNTKFNINDEKDIIDDEINTDHQKNNDSNNNININNNNNENMKEIINEDMTNDNENLNEDDI